MNTRFHLLSAALLLSLVGCQESSQGSKDIIAERYVHRYGYDVSKNEWETQEYPGQVISTKKNGITAITSYEDGLIHGTKTETYPHSQTIRYEEDYNRGTLTKRREYNIRGVKQTETEFLTPQRTVITHWYPSGTPKSREEFLRDQIVRGEYFNKINEIDSRIDNGSGEKILRNAEGDILSKHVYNEGQVTYEETYYPNNSPHTAVSYRNDKPHGERKVFAMSGEPLLVEHWHGGKLHGVVTHYQNGYKYKEVPFARGLRQGTECHYLDGESLVEEIHWDDNLRHGPSVVYYDGLAKTTWYFEGNKVSKRKFEELLARTAYIAAMNK